MAVRKSVVRTFILLFITFISFSQKSFARPGFFTIVNGLDSPINSIYKDLHITLNGEIFYNNKKILLDGVESQNRQFASYKNFHFWFGSFSASNKLVFFIGDYKKSNSHFYMINLDKKIAYDLGEAIKYDDIYLIGWSVDEKSLFLSHSIGSDNKGLIKINTENMKLEVADDLADFSKYSYLKNFLAYNNLYLYTKYVQSTKNTIIQNTIKTTKCDSVCGREYTDFIVAIDKFFVEIEKKKAELEKQKKDNNSINTKNGQQ